MLDDLVGVIETLQQRIRNHGATLRENETRTRMALIDPLLIALGWDVSDPAAVTPEYPISKGRADYALLEEKGEPAAVLEAKHLGEVLTNHTTQMVTYALEDGVAYAGLTDGDRWQIYDVFKPVALADKRVLDISISSALVHEIALKLLLLWRPNLASGQPAAANEPLLGSISVPSTAMSAAPEVPSVIETPRPIPPEPVFDSTGWVSLSEYNPPGGSKAPTVIRFPDHSEQEIKRWNDILVAVATWLHSSGRLTAADEPVSSSPKIYIVHNRPIHPTGNEFFQHKTIASGQLTVNTHGSGSQMRKNSQTLLNRYGVSPNDVWLKVAE